MGLEGQGMFLLWRRYLGRGLQRRLAGSPSPGSASSSPPALGSRTGFSG